MSSTDVTERDEITVIRDPEPPTKRRYSRLMIATVAVVVAFGIWERWVLLRHSSLQPDADESMTGLMARNLLKGNGETFLWGQPYGGAAEIIPVAAMIEIFGSNLFAMRAFGIALGAVAPILMWRVASRLLSPSGAIVAALTMWVWPVALISWSLREFLYYQPVLCVGLAGILCTQRALESPRNFWWPLGTGVFMGLGWWMSPFITYFGLFVVLTIVASRNWEWITKRAPLTVVGFVVGAMPWLSYNLGRDLISLHEPPGATGGSYVSHLDYFLHPGIAVATGLKGWYSKAWPFDDRTFGHLLLFAGIAVALFVAARAFYRFAKRQEKLPVDLICLAVWPFIYAMSPMTGSDELWVPRYFFFLWPFMAFVIGRVVEQRRFVPLAMVFVMAFAGIGVSDQVKRVNDWPYTGELRKQVAANGVTHMFTSYWVAYKIVYETDEKLIATPAYPPSVRYKPYDIMVRQSTNPAWAFRAGDQREQRWLEATRNMGMNLQPIRAGAYNLYLPDRMVTPEDVPTNALIDPIEGV